MRPNAIPAKDFYRDDAKQRGIKNKTKALNGGRRHSIQDLCDFCSEVGFVSRQQLGLRKSGYKFGCKKCHDSGKFKWKKEGSTEKILPMLPSAVVANVRGINPSI